MNRRQLVEKIAERFETTKVNADEMLNTFIAIIEDSLLAGQEVNIHGFGRFSVSNRKGRLGYNPKTGDRMDIAAYSTASFKPGKPLKEKLTKKFN